MSILILKNQKKMTKKNYKKEKKKNLSKFIKETIDNNFISRTLLAGLKIKYNELEYEDESWNKYEFIRTIYDSLNDMMEQVLKIWDKKCKKIIKR